MTRLIVFAIIVMFVGTLWALIPSVYAQGEVLLPPISSSMIATATPTVPLGRYVLQAQVFIDYRCDRFYQQNVDLPLDNVEVAIQFENGSVATGTTRALIGGRVYMSNFDPGQVVTVTAVLPEVFKGRALGVCPTSRTEYIVHRSDFGVNRSKFVQFGMMVLGEVAGPLMR